MDTFIGQLVKTLLEENPGKLDQLCVVFPSRRATVFFRESLIKAIDKPLWAPEVFSIEDFTRDLSQLTVLDKVSLAFELYPIYQDHFPDESFDKFYSWGSMLLGDFDEIDRYLINAKDVFVNLYELKRIDTTIESWLNEDGKPSPFQQNYLDFWQLMGTFYEKLKKKLNSKKLAMGGMALRQIAEQIQKEKPTLKWDKIIFAGFNAMAPAEELLMKSLVDWGLAECYWDMDEYYVKDEFQEAGSFFRDLIKRWKSADSKAIGWNWIENRHSSVS